MDRRVLADVNARFSALHKRITQISTNLSFGKNTQDERDTDLEVK